MIGVCKHQHILQDLNQRLYLFSFPGHCSSLTISFFRDSSSSSSHPWQLPLAMTDPAPNRPPPHIRRAAPGRRKQASSPAVASTHSQPHQHPRPPVASEGGGSRPLRPSSSVLLPHARPKPRAGACRREGRGVAQRRATPGWAGLSESGPPGE